MSGFFIPDFIGIYTHYLVELVRNVKNIKGLDKRSLVRGISKNSCKAMMLALQEFIESNELEIADKGLAAAD